MTEIYCTLRVLTYIDYWRVKLIFIFWLFFLAALVEPTPKDERTEFNFAPQPPDVDCVAILGCTCWIITTCWAEDWGWALWDACTPCQLFSVSRRFIWLFLINKSLRTWNTISDSLRFISSHINKGLFLLGISEIGIFVTFCNNIYLQREEHLVKN